MISTIEYYDRFGYTVHNAPGFLLEIMFIWRGDEYYNVSYPDEYHNALNLLPFVDIADAIEESMH